MNERVKKIITVLLISLAFLMEIHFFHLFPIPYPVDLLVKKQTGVGTGFLAIIVWALYFKDRTNRFLDLFCYFVIVVFALTTLKSYFSVNHGIKQTFGATSGILCFLYSKPLFILWKDKKAFGAIFYILAIIGFIWHLVSILQDYLYVSSSKVILYQYFDSNILITTRSGGKHIRISSGYVICLLFEIYNIFRYLFNKNKIKKLPVFLFNLVMLCTGLYATYFIGQTRSTLLAIVISAIVLLFLACRSKRQRISLGVLLGLAFFELLATGKIQEYLSSFSLDSDNIYYVNSNANRLYEYYECVDIFLHNPILGRGLYYGDIYREVYWSTTMGDTLWVNDVGIFGVFASSGIFGALIFFIPAFRMIYLLMTNKKRESGENYSLVVSLFTYFILTWISSLDLGRSGGINTSMIIASFEFINYQNGKKVDYKFISCHPVPNNKYI